MGSREFRTAIVIGASSGIGADLARLLAASGTRVALVARREADLRRLATEIAAAHGEDRVLVHVHDVTDYDAVAPSCETLERELGEVDLVAYVAGTLPDVGPDEFSFAKDCLTMEVNLLGAMAWLDHAAVRMQAARRGTLLAVSSVAGDRGRRGSPAYCASKAGLNTFMESLRNRLTQHGVRVVTVRPGFVATPMTAHLDLPARMTVDSPTAARLILAAARGGRTDVYVPRRWALVMFVIRHIPSFIFRKLPI